MKSNGQIGLDYLVAYGWIFLAVATFFGLLSFVLAPQATGVSCASNEPGLISAKGVNIQGSGSELNEIVLGNESGAEIKITGAALDETGYISGSALATINGKRFSEISEAAPLAVAAGGGFSVKNFFVNTEKGRSGGMTINYLDSIGQAHEAGITCGGLPA